MIPCKLVPLTLTLTAIIAIALSAVPSVRDNQAVLRNPIGDNGVIPPPKPIGNDQDILAVLYWYNNTDGTCTGSGTELNLTADACQILPSHVVKLESTICRQVVIAIDRCVGNPIVLLEDECVNAEFHDTIQAQGCNE